jgi:aminopeptidase N
MISLVYAKFDYGWKLARMNLQPYTVNNKTAPQLYALAVKANQENHYSNTETFAELANFCSTPNDYWKYEVDSQIRDLAKISIIQANKHTSFPMLIEQIDTEPRLLYIANKRTNKGTYPMVYYETVVKLADTNAVKKENMAMRKVIGKIIPGIDQDNDHVLFSAFNKLPNTKVSVERFEMDWKLK